ncbi:MAG: hypothetical protein DRI57_13225 [Deltaproteobacteria bacterium]|nr:MAG: hypothetical protein DRI57_13225 [Deltaproteobacteria bacterium]
MKFRFDNGLIWISLGLKYEGKPIEIANCILDTGSATTAIDIDFVDFNYRKPAFIRRLCGLGGGIQEVACQRIDKLVIDKTDMRNVEIEFGDIVSGLGINGFVGNDILSRFSFNVDFSKQKIDMTLQK